MLTDTTLKNLKPKGAPYKVTDRDGMYVTVSTAGTVTFRYDYRINSRRETLTIGRYGPGGLSLARAREKCIDAKRAVSEGQSPAQEKQRAKRRLSEAQTFQEFTDKWYEGARMADSTRSMRKSVIDRDILPVFKSRLLNESRCGQGPVSESDSVSRIGIGGRLRLHDHGGLVASTRQGAADGCDPR